MNPDSSSGGGSTDPCWNVQGKARPPQIRGFSSTDRTQMVPSQAGDGSFQPGPSRSQRGGFGPQPATVGGRPPQIRGFHPIETRQEPIPAQPSAVDQFSASSTRRGFDPQPTSTDIQPHRIGGFHQTELASRDYGESGLGKSRPPQLRGFSTSTSETQMAPSQPCDGAFQPESSISRRGGFGPQPNTAEGRPPQIRGFYPIESQGFTPSQSVFTPTSTDRRVNFAPCSTVDSKTPQWTGFESSTSRENNSKLEQQLLPSSSFKGTCSDPRSGFYPPSSDPFQRGFNLVSQEVMFPPQQYSGGLNESANEKIERRNKAIALLEEERQKQFLKAEKQKKARETNVSKREQDYSRRKTVFSDNGFSPNNDDEELEEYYKQNEDYFKQFEDKYNEGVYVMSYNPDANWASLMASLAEDKKNEKKEEKPIPPPPVTSANKIAKFLRDFNARKINEKDQVVADKAEKLMEELQRLNVSFDKDSLSMLLNDSNFPPVPVLRKGVQMPRPVVLDGCAVARAYSPRYTPFFEGTTRNWTQGRILPMKGMVEAALHFITNGHKVYIVLPEYYMEPTIGVNKCKTVDDVEAYEMLKKHGILHFIEPDVKHKLFKKTDEGELTNIQIPNRENIRLKNMFEKVQEFAGKIHACFCSSIEMKYAYMRMEHGKIISSGGEEWGQMMEGKLDQQKILRARENADERIMNVSFTKDGRYMHMVRQFSHYAGEKTKIKDKNDFVYVRDDITMFYTELDGDEADYGKRMSQQLKFEDQVLQCLDLCQAYELHPINERAIVMLLMISYKQGILKQEIKAFAKKFARSMDVAKDLKELSIK